MSRDDGRRRASGRVAASAALAIFVGASAFAQEIPAEAQTSVVCGGLKWTLSVYKTTVQRRDFSRKTSNGLGEIERRADPVWVKITATNVGHKDVWIADDILTDRGNFPDLMGEQISNRWPPYIAATGPDHKRVAWEKEDAFLDGSPLVATAPPDRAAAEKVAAWRRQGVSNDEIKARLDAEDRQRRAQGDSRFAAAHPSFYLKPGRSVSTRTWVYPGKYPADRPQPPAPIGDFAELWNYHFDRPGSYKLWLVVKGGKTSPITVKVLP